MELLQGGLTMRVSALLQQKFRENSVGMLQAWPRDNDRLRLAKNLILEGRDETMRHGVLHHFRQGSQTHF